MASFEIFFKESVWKDLKKISKKDVRKILKKIGSLSNDPHPSGCEKLTGEEQYRIRQGRYRILYSIQEIELTVWVVKVGHRRGVYR